MVRPRLQKLLSLSRLVSSEHDLNILYKNTRNQEDVIFQQVRLFSYTLCILMFSGVTLITFTASPPFFQYFPVGCTMLHNTGVHLNKGVRL